MTRVLKINVDVIGDVVTLSGEVDCAIVKQQAGEIARQTGGVKLVCNLLKVRT